jgi:hypothetical protein
MMATDPTPAPLPAGRQLDAMASADHDDPESLGQAAWVYETERRGINNVWSEFTFQPNRDGTAIHEIRLPPAWRLAPDPTHGVVLLSVTGQRMTAAEAVGRFGVGQDRA